MPKKGFSRRSFLRDVAASSTGAALVSGPAAAQALGGKEIETTREYRRLRRDSALGRRTVLDEYGAEDPVEFFAVATESFFEEPVLLKGRHPQLYAELAEFYRQDPAGLFPESEVA
jgi:hypothetical protein